MNEEYDIKEHSLREVMEYTRNITISSGGLALIIEKIVEEIEKLQHERGLSLNQIVTMKSQINLMKKIFPGIIPDEKDE